MADTDLIAFLKAYGTRRAEKFGLKLSEDDLKAISSMSSRKDVKEYISTMGEKPVEKPKPKAKKTSRQKKSVKSSESDAEEKQSETDE
tara:strand:+ start:342 stop:605 length:264 start_codon:yes stop_codon:yes gene_type:complete